MKRREFLNTGLLTLGGMMIGRNFTFANAMDETSDSFKNTKGNNYNNYDLIINGAGFSGFFAALEAAKRNLKVLVIDKRTSPGYDITAKRKLWLQKDGIEKWDENMLDLFFPEGELAEMLHKELLSAPRSSRAKEEMLLFAGSIKKGMMRSLLVNKVDVLLMNDVCGIVTDKNNSVSGVIVASKHGTYSISCGSFLDASDQNLFTRDLFGQKYKIRNAGFVLELEGVGELSESSLSVSDSFGVLNNRLEIHKGKKAADQYLIEYRFAVETNDLSTIEQKARSIAFEISKKLPDLSPAFSKTELRYYALECSFEVEGKMDTSISLKNYDYIENPGTVYSCNSILQIIETARKKAEKINEYSTPVDKDIVYYIGGNAPFKGTKETISENGHALPLSPFAANTLSLKKKETSILIVGGGTAGAMAALAAKQKGFQPTIVEYFNDLGGTKTMGGVFVYYRGLQQNVIMKNFTAEVKQISADYHMKGTMPLCCKYLRSILDNDCNIINGAIFCGTNVVNKRLKSITICENGKLMQIEADLTIDATGDADVAYFAGEGYDIGDTRMEMTQNYSQWDVPFRPEVDDVHKDYDILDNTEIWELQRGLYLSHYESHYYDFYPMLTVRDSRRPHGLYTLDTADIIKEKYFEDTISQAKSDFDAHYFASSEYSRCGFLLPHMDQNVVINIPYRSLVPKTIDGLLYSGKAISETWGAIQYTRMAPDVTILGFLTGLLAAEIVRQGVQPRDFSVAAIQKEFIDKSYLLENPHQDPSSINSLVYKLVCEDSPSLSKACLEEKAVILPRLEKTFRQNKTPLLAKALAWFGNTEGVDLLSEELGLLFNQEKIAGHSSTYHEYYRTNLLYWQINQDIALLGMAPCEGSNEVIHRILKHTGSGGKMVINTWRHYNRFRIDYELVPFYNRILNLSFYIERNPNKLFINGLDKLLEEPNLSGFKTTEYNQVKARVYGANLELYIAAAAARSGSKKGMERLIDYLTDIHSNFRQFAHRELVAIFHKDFEYETHQWIQFVNQNIKIAHSVTPLVKAIEY